MTITEITSKKATKTNLGVVVAVPFFSQSDNLNTDSNYAYLRLILPEMARQSPDTLFLMLFPDPKYGQGTWRYTSDNLQSDRIKFISWPYDTAMRTGVLGFDPVRFAYIDHNYGPSTYWLHQVEMGAALYGGYRQAGSQLSRPILLAQHHYIIHRSLPYAYEYMFPRLWYQMGGSVAADRIVYNSDHTYRMADESFSEYLNTDQMKSLKAKSKLLRFGLVNGDEPEAPAADKDTKPVFVYNHRFEGYKMPQVTAGILNELRADFDFEVWVTQSAGQKTRGFPVDKQVFAPSRMDYLRNIAVPGINTINSVHETFCIAMLDSIMVGQLPVAPNSVTFPELVPDGYPYLFNNEDEQRAILRTILRDFENIYNEWRPKLIEHARKKFGLEAYVDQYLQVLVDEETRKREGQTPKPHVLKAAEELVKNMKPGKAYGLRELTRIFQRSAGLSNQSAPPARVTREASMRGIHFVWDNGVKLVKPKN